MEILRVLHLEDNPDFTVLVTDLLQRDGFAAEMVHVADFPAFNLALESESFDIILADYLLPSCNGIHALQAACEKRPEVPFLLVSGTIGEQAAIESLRCGATDYVLKNRLERLVPAVRRAVQEARERAHRRHVETELVRREKYFRTLTENCLDVLTILNGEGLFQYNSPSLKTVLGYEPRELVGRNAFALIHPEDLAKAQQVFETALQFPERRITHEFRFRHADGSWKHLEVVGQNRMEDPEIAGVVINSRDISDRKRAEAEVRESGEQYRLIFEGSPVPMWLADMKTLRFLEVNEAAVRHYGYSRDEFLERSITDIRSPEETARDREYLAGIVTDQRPKGRLGHAGLWRHRKKDGTHIDVEITWSIITFHGRETLLTIANDVTEHYRAAEALKKSEASLASAQRIAHLGSWEMDLNSLEELEGNPLHWSDETCRIFGCEPGRVKVSSEFFLSLVHPGDRQRVTDALKEAFRTGEPYDMEYRVILSDRGERIVRERAEFAFDSAGRPSQLRGVVMDITERKGLEEQLRQSQKMEAIGQLAGGVAHDFNNILTVIHGHASLLLGEATLALSGRKSAEQIIQAAERAAGLTRQLLTFSRRQVLQPKRINLNETVSNMTMMLGRILGEDITLQMSYWGSPACIQADGGMIEQVLLNLAVNARDAMPRGGQMEIRIYVTEIGPAHRMLHPEARAGKVVCLSVADNGCGIEPDVLRRIFEPFFTTKEVGKGTGLGLATVYGIVKQHQGWIEVESEPGEGTTFRVYFPHELSASAPNP